MPKYVEGEEKKYFSTVLAILIVIAAAIGFFVYSLLTGADKISEKVEVVKLNPSSELAFPNSSPSIEQPTIPPPSE